MKLFTLPIMLRYLLKWSVLAVILALPIGSASAIFLHSLQLVTLWRENHLWITAFLPIGGFAIGWLYHRYGKNVAAGNNLLLAEIYQPQAIIPLRMAPLVYLGTMVTHLLGGSAGREGTALQMAGAIADQFTRPLRLSPADRQILLMAAMAAGFGSVFGTPGAGAVFAMEVLMLRRINGRAFFPVLLTAILAHFVALGWQAPHTHYHLDFIPPISAQKLLYALGAGAIFGLCAAFFSRSMRLVTRIFARISYPPLRPVVGGILVVAGVALLGTSKYMGLGIPTIELAFAQTLPAYDFVLKIIFTVITLSAGFKGGEVTPLFFIGAALGSALSLAMPLPTSLLAGMGFVAVFAGATNTPLACTIMGLELFGCNGGIYLASACAVAYLFSGRTSIYSRQQVATHKYAIYSHFARFLNHDQPRAQ